MGRCRPDTSVPMYHSCWGYLACKILGAIPNSADIIFRFILAFLFVGGHEGVQRSL